MEITLTPTAVATVRKLMEEHGAGEEAGLRVAVLSAGCSGFEYDLSIEVEPGPEDAVVEVEGLRVFMDPSSAPHLSGVQIDYVSGMMGSGFAFRNPNAAGGCGCASSSTV